jgi:DNA repair protein RecN (Recombination protein N)
MLKSLTVSNFALIEDAVVDFDEGLNILTGETGAGKSILIDALNMILGARASLEYIRTGCEFFRVEAVFDITADDAVNALLQDQGLYNQEDGIMIISRRYNRSGKNSILINGCHATLNILRHFGEKLVDMHGQHENQALLRPETYISLIDSFSKEVHGKIVLYRQVYREWQEICNKLADMEQKSRDRMQRLDMLSWQTQEIAAANLTAGEDAVLEGKIRVLANAEKISHAANRAYGLLSKGFKDSGGVTGFLAEIKRELELIVRFDPAMEAQLHTVTDVLYQLEEVSIDLREYCDNVDFNPGQLAEFQDRMDVIRKLQKKYGTTIEEILDYYNQSMDEISAITHFDEDTAKLISAREKLKQKLETLAEELDILRNTAARQMSGEIQEHLFSLGMPNAKIDIHVVRKSEYNLNGCNSVEILFSANAGEKPRFLQKIASGGELSRIALAIKTVCASRDHIGVIIFDEIDAGVGGNTAQMIGERIAMVAACKQVLCITHLPQIACMADSHIYIEKKVEDNRTRTIIKSLKNDERLVEVARMVSGSDTTRLGIENAAQMIRSAQEKKEKWKKEAQS